MGDLALSAGADAALEFGRTGVLAVNAVLAVIMFGVGLDLDVTEFRRIVRRPVGPVVGLVTQFLALPALATGLVLLLDPPAATALGVLLVASCPGGTVSNAVTHLAQANTSLSIAMTTMSTFAALAITPLNLAFWGQQVPSVAGLQVTLDPAEMILLLVAVVGLPVGLGVTVHARAATVASRLRGPMRRVAVLGLTGIIVGGAAANLGNVTSSLGTVLVTVVVVNVAALMLGYTAASAFRLPVRDRRAISIEIGMQNSALALTLAIQFFPDLAGAAVVAAIWGVWHLTTGLGLARWWSGVPLMGHERRLPAGAPAIEAE